MSPLRPICVPSARAVGVAARTSVHRRRNRKALALALLAIVPPGPSSLLPREPAAGPTGGGTVVLEPVPPAAAPRARVLQRRRVFTCVTPGLVTFSDKPCGPWPGLRELTISAPATGRPGDAGSVAPTAPPASTRMPATKSARDDEPEDRAAEAHAKVQACERLERAVADLDDRMRSGYSAREAGRLWARWREAKERQRQSDC